MVSHLNFFCLHWSHCHCHCCCLHYYCCLAQWGYPGLPCKEKKWRLVSLTYRVPAVLRTKESFQQFMWQKKQLLHHHPWLCKGTISYLKKRKAPKRRYTDLLLFFIDCEICHYSLGKALTNRQAEGTCQLHHLNGQSRVLRCFCSVHKLLQQFTSVKESKLNVPNSLFSPYQRHILCMQVFPSMYVDAAFVCSALVSQKVSDPLENWTLVLGKSK